MTSGRAFPGPASLPEHKAFLWKENLQTSTIADLLDRDAGEPHGKEDWEHWFYELAPEPQAIHIGLFPLEAQS